MENDELYDITIIGAGPAGLFSAFYSGLREMKTKVLECHPILGGKLNLYTEKMIWDVGGLPPLPGGKLVEHLVQQAKTFHPTIKTNEKIVSIDKDNNGNFILTAENGAIHYSKTVLLAIGWGILKPKKIELTDVEKFEKSNLNYTIQNPQSLKGKQVLLSGGGNSAVDWANLLEPIADSVHLVYRKDELKGHEAEVSKLLASKVKCHFNQTIEAFIPNESDTKIAKVQLKDSQSGATQFIEIDEVVINHGYEEESTIFKQNTVGLKQKDNYYIEISPAGISNVPGIFAAGDVVHHEGKLHLIAGAFQDAAIAVNQAKLYLDPTAHSHAAVSSHNDKFTDQNKVLVEEFFYNE